MAAPSRVSASSKDGGGPSVLVLIVATNGERWLPDALKSLKAQGHKPLEILAVDNASEDGSKAILTKALGAKRVVRLDRRVGYGRAVASGVKIAADRGIPTDALLLLHDDAALQPGALDLMLAALKEDRVGVVGVKLVEWDDSSRLQDVGGSTDRYGRLVPRVERGELDQGQFAGVHEVLFASSAAMLVSADVVERVGLFDPRYVALRDDFDFCWRARLAGFRVLVVADAAARHASAGYRQVRDSPVRGRVRYFSDRNMIASLIKNYGLVRLFVRLPVTVLISILNALFFLVSGRRRAALQAVEAVQWNLVHLPSTLRARLRTQSRRVVPDREITSLMVRGFPQLRSQLQQIVERVVGEVEEEEEEALGRPRPSIRERVAARRVGLLWAALTVLYLVGAHGVLRSGPLSGADMPPFRGAQELFTEFFSGWRSAGTGAAAPATPGLVLLGLLTYACIGSAWLAQRALVLGLPLAAGASMWRLATAAGLDAAPRRVAAVAYALSPLGLSALGAGRLSDLVLYAAAPALVTPLLRAAGLLPRAGAAWRSAAAGALGLAATASLAPWALAFVLGAGVVVAAASVTVAHGHAAVAVLRRTAVMVLGAVALLLPWAVELFRDPSPLGIGGSGGRARMRELLALQAGDVRPIPLVLSYGLPLAAVAGAALAVRARRDLTRALLVAAALSALAGWAVARGVPWIAPRPAQPLILAAVAVAVAAGIALDGVRPALAEREFGWRHVAIPVLAALAVVELGAAVVWIARGDRPGIVRSGDLQPAFLAAEERQLGDFRVLWIAGTRSSPRVALAAPTGVTMAAYGARPGGAGADALRATVAAIAAGATDAGGRALGTFGVRYVIARPETEPAVIDALARQTALRFVQRFHGATVFRNDAAIPVAASIAAPGWVRASRRAGLAATAGAEPAPAAGPGFRRVAPGAFDGRSSRQGRLLVLAQDFGNWSAVTTGKPVAPERSFEWATAFRISGAHPVAVRWQGQAWHRLALVGQLLVLLVFATAWSRAAARERGER